MCPDPMANETKGPKLKKMLSIEGMKEGKKQIKKVNNTFHSDYKVGAERLATMR